MAMPAAPVAPVAPIASVASVAETAPVAPVAPIAPIAPEASVTSVAQIAPAANVFVMPIVNGHIHREGNNLYNLQELYDKKERENRGAKNGAGLRRVMESRGYL